MVTSLKKEQKEIPFIVKFLKVLQGNQMLPSLPTLEFAPRKSNAYFLQMMQMAKSKYQSVELAK